LSITTVGALGDAHRLSDSGGGALRRHPHRIRLLQTPRAADPLCVLSAPTATVRSPAAGKARGTGTEARSQRDLSEREPNDASRRKWYV